MTRTPPIPDASEDGDAFDIDDYLCRYRPLLHGFFRLNAGEVVRAREDGSDLAQSVCVEILRRRNTLQFRGESEFRNLLFATARNKLHSKRRYYGRHRRDNRREIAFPEAGSKHDALLVKAYRTVYTPSQDLASREELERFERVFLTLPEHYREVITLHRMGGQTYEQIGRMHGETPDAVRMRLVRGMAKLALLLELDDGKAATGNT